MSMMRHSYGCLKDKDDSRDRILAAEHFKGIVIPERVDLRPENPPVYDQENIGSCTGNAGSRSFEHMVFKEIGSFKSFSRMGLYNLTRKSEGNFNYDSGATLRGTIKTMVKYGMIPEELFPYDEKNLFVMPSTAVLSAAEKWQALSYYRIPARGLLLLKQALAKGCTPIFGAAVYESFESDEAARTGIIPMPDVNTEEFLGGHALCAVGYDDDNEHVITANSWGVNWGDAGFAYIPYKYFTTHGPVSDIWVLTSTEIGK